MYHDINDIIGIITIKQFREVVSIIMIIKRKSIYEIKTNGLRIYNMLDLYHGHGIGIIGSNS